jgi:hypothetical protein
MMMPVAHVNHAWAVSLPLNFAQAMPLAPLAAPLAGIHSIAHTLSYTKHTCK